MNISDYPFGTKSRDKIESSLLVHLLATHHYKYDVIHKLTTKQIEILVHLYHKVVIKSINDSIDEKKPFRMHKFATLKIKKANELAYQIKDKVAREAGYDGYVDVPRAERVKIRNESSKIIKKDKLILKTVKKKLTGGNLVTLDFNKIKKVSK